MLVTTFAWLSCFIAASPPVLDSGAGALARDRSRLRQRTLGPILEGNGWAVNGRVKINIPFGTKLTDLAVLPEGAKRSLEDPYEDKDAARRRRLIWVLLIVLAAAAAYVRWDHNQRGHYFWQNPPPPAPAAAPAAESAPAEAVPAPEAAK